MRIALFIPEITMLSTAFVFLCLACRPAQARRDFAVASVLAAISLAASVFSANQSGMMFQEAYRVDLFSQVFKVFLATGYFLVVFLCHRLEGVAAHRHSEYYFLLATCTLAMMLLASAVHLAVMFMALELSSYSLYLLVLLRRERRWGMPSGLRYFLVGATASAIMLFGMALVYGASGSMHLNDILTRVSGVMSRPAVAAGLMLTLSGLFFKLAVFPFHLWAPDVYEGAPNQVAAFIASVSKVAAVAVLVRIISAIEGMGDLLAQALVVLAIVSMTVGNLSAIAQKDFKRLMAFSSIAHAGYLLVGVLCMSTNGYAAVAFYAAAVLVMKLTCFMVMIKLAPDGRNLQIAELAGLHRRAPLLAMALMLALFGLAGIPPTIGFAGKLLIFSAAMQQGYLILVIIAMVNVVISLYYYLLVLKAAYLDKAKTEQPPLALSLLNRIVVFALIIIIVGVGFYPTALIDVVLAAARGIY